MYNIGEVAKILGLSKDKLRYYEEKGIIAPSQDDENNYRKYDYQDILAILSIEFYRSLDIDFKTIKSIHGKSRIDEIESVLELKKSEVRLEIERLRRIEARIEDLEAGCRNIKNGIGEFAIRSLGPIRVLGEISDFTAFDEYERIHELRPEHSGESIIKSLIRQLDFDETGLKSTKMLIIDDRPGAQVEDIVTLDYDRCVYTIVEDSLAGESNTQEVFLKTRAWMAKNGFWDRNIAFLRMVLMEPKAERSKSYLELFIPVMSVE